MLNMLDELRSTTKRTEKELILQKYKFNNDAQTYLKCSLNPFWTFGIDKIVIPHLGNKKMVGQYFEDFRILLFKLRDRKLTGNDARNTISSFIKNFDSQSQDLIVCAIKKDLRAGLSEKTVNKIMPGLIPVFDVQLATKLESLSDLNQIQTYRVEPKFDGLRLISIYKDGVISFYTRNGNVLELPKLRIELKKIMREGDVFDGELISNLGFQSLMSAKKKKIDESHMSYTVFDYIPVDCFERGNSTTPLNKRLYTLEIMFKSAIKNGLNKNIVFKTPDTLAYPKDIMEYYNKIIAQGYEGIMIKDLNSGYECKRSKSWLKVKPINDMDCKILDVLEGTGKNKGSFGSFLVAQENGKLAQIGIGFSDKQREEIWKNKKQYKSRCVEAKYQELTKDGIMRFPVFVKFRIDK